MQDCVANAVLKNVNAIARHWHPRNPRLYSVRVSATSTARATVVDVTIIKGAKMPKVVF
jgi:hypothetical protein